jgi:uncharacterized delta-60 repeat protein
LKLLRIVLSSLVVFSLAVDGLATVGQPGSLDHSWGTTSPQGAGKVRTGVGSFDDYARASALQPDGKLVVVGECGTNIGTSFCVVRYLSDGSLDLDWNQTGKAITAIGGDSSKATALALQSDGKVVVAGECFATSGNLAFCVARYNADGTLDNSWQGTGYAITEIGTRGDSAQAVAVSGGHVYVAGNCTIDFGDTDFCVVRYTSTGALDVGWNGSGKVVTPIVGNNADLVKALAASSVDGRVLVAGTCSVGGLFSFCSARYSSTGSLDASWGGTGTLVTPIADNGVQMNAVRLEAGGSALFAGSCFGGTVNGVCSARLQENGALDPSWGGVGYVITPTGTNGDAANAIAVDGQNRILLAGSCGTGLANSFCSLRYRSNGALDPSWGNNGKAATPIGRADGAVGIAIQANDDRVLFAGYCGGGLNVDFCAIRYDGGLDASAACTLDLDGDGQVLAVSDGLLQLRVAQGRFGDVALNGVGQTPGATRTTWPVLREFMRVNPNDFDGDGRVEVATDALIHLRIALGFVENQVIEGIVFPSSATRTTWNTIRAHINETCGASLP